MFQHLFAEMNKMLQEIQTDFPTAEGARRSDLLSKYNMLHRISDNVMDEWLVFAEKLSEFREQADFRLRLRNCRRKKRLSLGWMLLSGDRAITSC